MRAPTLALTLAAICSAAFAQDSFKALFDAHQWFALRDATSAGPAPSLYRGAVAYAFRDLGRAEQELKRAIKAAPRSEQAITARGLLISVAQMRGEYGQALSHIRAIQALEPANRNLDNGASFFSALADFPRQRVSKKRSTKVRYSMNSGNMFIPVNVDDKPASYIFDTGANFSVLSESEAARLGLTVHDGGGSHGIDAAGNRVGYRVALASKVSAGAFEIRNVVFLVARDDQQPFVDLPAGSRGVLGIPVALAFETAGWNDDGEFEIASERPRSSIRDSNLCFDGANLLFMAEYRGEPISAFLDTGATTTRLMPKFAKQFPADLAGATEGISTIRGVGGAAKAATVTLPQISLRVSGVQLALSSAEVLLGSLGGHSEPYHVWAGLDLFKQAHKTIIDLRSMRLVVE